MKLLVLLCIGFFVQTNAVAQLADNQSDYKAERIKYLQSELDLDEWTVNELTLRIEEIEPEHSARDWKKTRLAYEQILKEVLGIEQIKKLSGMSGLETQCLDPGNNKYIAGRSSKAINHTMAIAPNPTATTTTISYHIDEPGFTTISLTDVQGNKLSTLISEYKEAGDYTELLETDIYVSNIYLVTLRVGNSVISEKLIIQK